MRLNGWQRIGVIASVCWAIGGGLWINYHDHQLNERLRYGRVRDVSSRAPSRRAARAG